MHAQTNKRGRLKYPSAITRMSVHFVCGLMSDLVICKIRKQYARTCVFTDTRCQAQVVSISVSFHSMSLFVKNNYH